LNINNGLPDKAQKTYNGIHTTYYESLFNQAAAPAELENNADK
jgi:hypothetical protein